MKTFCAILVLCTAVRSAAQSPFQTQTIDSSIEIGYGLAIGDVDGDKKPDILLADKKQFVWYRNGDWKRFVMVDNLTPSDNVCIAARDIDGDGLVEVAVGAQWNPGETSDTTRSGSVHYLVRPDDPTTPWLPVALHHEPTIHRMRWIEVSPSRYHLIVLPLHGRGNKDGKGKGVRVFSYEMPKDPKLPWKLQWVDSTMHLTHNLDVVREGKSERLYIGGKEGAKVFSFEGGHWKRTDGWVVKGDSFGELRIGAGKGGRYVIAGIQPMHGSTLVVYLPGTGRKVIADGFNQGHALAAAVVTKSATIQVLAGWREPDSNGQVGIKLFTAKDEKYDQWTSEWIDKNDMACEDLQVADLNGDGNLDIIASGRSTHNLKIYWNKR